MLARKVLSNTGSASSMVDVGVSISKTNHEKDMVKDLTIMRLTRNIQIEDYMLLNNTFHSEKRFNEI